jgi:hypothetical protein
MTRFFLINGFTTLVRALLAHGCGEAFRFLLDRIAPDMPPLVGVAIGLILGVVLIELVALLWRRYEAADAPSSQGG